MAKRTNITLVTESGDDLELEYDLPPHDALMAAINELNATGKLKGWLKAKGQAADKAKAPVEVAFKEAKPKPGDPIDAPLKPYPINAVLIAETDA